MLHKLKFTNPLSIFISSRITSGAENAISAGNDGLFVVCSLVRDDLSSTSLLSIMQNLLLLMWTTLKLLWGFGTTSQSKLFAAINHGHCNSGEWWASWHKPLPASSACLLLNLLRLCISMAFHCPRRINDCLIIEQCHLLSHDALLTRIAFSKVEQGYGIIILCNSP